MIKQLGLSFLIFLNFNWKFEKKKKKKASIKTYIHILMKNKTKWMIGMLIGIILYCVFFYNMLEKSFGVKPQTKSASEGLSKVMLAEGQGFKTCFSCFCVDVF